MGDPMRKPPANALPPRTEWQATQSPARARYSPSLLGVAVCCALAAAPVPSTRSAVASDFIRSIDRFNDVDSAVSGDGDAAGGSLPRKKRRPKEPRYRLALSVQADL
jgi:hypothetical protein